MKNSHLAISIASSIALGAIIGMLFAPDKGSNIRKKFVQKGNDWKKYLQTSGEATPAMADTNYSNKSATSSNDMSKSTTSSSSTNMNSGMGNTNTNSTTNKDKDSDSKKTF
jgi:gas vesicle protein